MIKKKLTALIAVLLVCVMLFPTAAFAYAPDEESTPVETQTAQSADAPETDNAAEQADESESGEDDALPFDTDVLTTLLAGMDPEILEVLKEHPKLIAMFLPTLHVTVREGSVTISIDKQEQEDPGQTGTVSTQGSNLNVRTGPSTGYDIITQLMNGTDVKVLGEKDGWYQIDGGYISSEFAEKRFSLNEARKLDVRAMVLNYYDNPGVSNVTNYLNIRQGAGKDEKVIGKLPSYAGCEILEDTGNGWYKIRSGNITGYVSSEFILTGDAARQAAMEHAELMAIVSTDRLNARTEPSTDAKIWTQISNNERYHVAEQLDGWVKIEFDEGGEGDGADEVSAAYVSTDYVDVRYALAEAIKFSPAEESASLRSQVVNYAMQFLGNPYVWGGTSLTRGADCSGFTMSVMKHFGISLPH